MFEEAKAVSDAKRRIFQDVKFVTSLDSILGAPPVEKGRRMAMTIVEGKTDLDIDLILSCLQEDIVLAEGCLNNNAVYEQVKHLATSQDFVSIQSLSQREILNWSGSVGRSPKKTMSGPKFCLISTSEKNGFLNCAHWAFVEKTSETTKSRALSLCCKRVWISRMPPLSSTRRTARRLAQ